MFYREQNLKFKSSIGPVVSSGGFNQENEASVITGSELYSLDPGTYLDQAQDCLDLFKVN